MKVFISWSGQKSKIIATALETWLKQVIQAVEPWISIDITKGVKWGSEIADRLEKSKIGIICLTSANLNERWILFEAGALSKTKDAHVCTLLLDVKPADVKQPLAQFQHTTTEKEDIYQLVQTINQAVKNSGEKSLDEPILEEVFKMFWPRLEKSIEEAITYKESIEQKVRSEREILEEILLLARSLKIELKSKEVVEEEVEAMAKQVEAMKKELSSFIFTVSHDLKTPLIALHGYLGLFREEFQQAFDETGKEYFERILYNAEYMDKMINDLLKLSRAGRVIEAKRNFSSSKLVKEVYMSFYPQIQQKKINFNISKSLPTIYGDRKRLQTVFENLIQNAIKYTTDKRSPYIEISCKNKEEFYEFSIKDNGVGIDPSDHKRIFDVFQKCGHKANDSDGTGIGLTIVKRIIDHHGGTIWVDSKLDEGATFYFTIPKLSRK